MSPTAGYLLIAVAVALAGSGCATDARCDPGQELRGGLCFAAVPDAGAPVDGRAADSATDECSGVDGGPGDFGAPCTDGAAHSDCDCPAPYCAITPGDSEGSCTRTGCVEAPERCPSGYRCIDLSLINPSLPSICTAE